MAEHPLWFPVLPAAQKKQAALSALALLERSVLCSTSECENLKPFHLDSLPQIIGDRGPVNCGQNPNVFSARALGPRRWDGNKRDIMACGLQTLKRGWLLAQSRVHLEKPWQILFDLEHHIGHDFGLHALVVIPCQHALQCGGKQVLVHQLRKAYDCGE